MSRNEKTRILAVIQLSENKCELFPDCGYQTAFEIAIALAENNKFHCEIDQEEYKIRPSFVLSNPDSPLHQKDIIRKLKVGLCPRSTTPPKYHMHVCNFDHLQVFDDGKPAFTISWGEEGCSTTFLGDDYVEPPLSKQTIDQVRELLKSYGVLKHDIEFNLKKFQEANQV